MEERKLSKTCALLCGSVSVVDICVFMFYDDDEQTMLLVFPVY